MLTGVPHQVGLELSTDLEGGVTFQATHCTLSGALPSPGKQVPFWYPLIWIFAPDERRQSKAPYLRSSHPLA